MSIINTFNRIDDLPNELIAHVFSFLDIKSLISCAQVQKNWHQEIKEYQWVEKRFFYSRAFTSKDWRRWVGSPSPEPDPVLPDFLNAITHLKKIYREQKLSRLFFAWIPEKIDGLPLNFSVLNRLKIAKNLDNFFYATPLSIQDVSQDGIEKSSWWAVNMEALETSSYKTYTQQTSLVGEENIPKEFEMILLIHLYFWKTRVHPLKAYPPGEIIRCRRDSQKFFLTPAVGLSSNLGIVICHLVGSKKSLEIKILPAYSFS